MSKSPSRPLPRSGYRYVYRANTATVTWMVTYRTHYYGTFSDLIEAARVADFASGKHTNCPDLEPLDPKLATSRCGSGDLGYGENLTRYRVGKLSIGRSFRREFPGTTWTVVKGKSEIVARFKTEAEAQAHLTQLAIRRAAEKQLVQ